jgi:hypothetical protein
MSKKYTIEKKMIAQVRCYETLYIIHDERGERIYTGSQEAATRIAAVLNRYSGAKIKPKNKRVKR